MITCIKKLAGNLIALNLAPVISVYILCWLIWLALTKGHYSQGYMVLIELLYNLLVLPVFLLVENYRHSVSKRKYSFILNIFWIICAALISDGLFFMKGIITGVLRFGSEILWGFIILMMLNMGLILIVGFIMQLLLNKRAKKS